MDRPNITEEQKAMAYRNLMSFVEVDQRIRADVERRRNEKIYLARMMDERLHNPSHNS